MSTNGAAESDAHAAFPLLPAYKAGCQALPLDRCHCWKIVVKHEIVWVPDARQSDEGNARSASFRPKLHDCLVQSHALRFPRSQCPAQHEWELRALDIAVFVAVPCFGQDWYPRSALFVARVKRRTDVLRAIHHDRLRHALRRIWVVRACGTNWVDDLLDNALRSVHEAVIHRQVVGDDDASAFGQFQCRCKATKVLFPNGHAICLVNTFVLRIESDNRHFAFTSVAQKLASVESLAIVFGVVVALPAELHDDRRVVELSALSDCQVGFLALAQPVVVFKSPSQVS